MRKCAILALAISGAAFAGPALVRAQADTKPAVPVAKAGGVQQQFDVAESILLGLNLTADQKTKIKAIFDTAKEKSQAFRQAHQEALSQLQQEMKAARESKDEDKIKAVKEKYLELMKDAPSRKEVLAQLKEVLTPEQEQQFRAAMAEKFPGTAGKDLAPGSKAAPGPLAMLQHALEDLHLSADQKEKLDPIINTARENYKTWLENNKEALQDAQQEMKAARESGDTAKMAAARSKLAELHKGAPDPKQLIGQITALLTPDQQAKFEAKIKEFEEQRGGGKAKDDKLP